MVQINLINPINRVNSKHATPVDSEVKGEYADMILGKDFTAGSKVKIESGNNISLCNSVQRTCKADIDSGHLDYQA